MAVENKLYPGFFEIPGNNKTVISVDGNCINLHTGNVIKTSIGGAGYQILKVWDGEKIHSFNHHRLMALAFLEKPERLSAYDFDDLEVNHKDSDRANNALSNLEWCTPKENIAHARLYGGIDDAIPVKARNLKTGEVVEYSSLAECCREHDIFHTYLSKHLKADDVGKVTKSWWVFVPVDYEVWPEVLPDECWESSWDMEVYWEVEDGKSGIITRVRSIPEVAALLDISENIVRNTRKRYGQDYPVAGCFVRKRFGQRGQEVEGMTVLDDRRFPPPVDILVINKETGEKFIVGSQTQASQLTGVKVGTISYGLKSKKIYEKNGYTFEKFAA